MFSQSLSMDWRHILYWGDDSEDCNSIEFALFNDHLPNNSPERLPQITHSSDEFDWDVPF